MGKPRDRSRDGWKNRLEFLAMTSFGGAWRLAQRIDWLNRYLNRTLINSAIYKTATRPYPFSTMADYTSWDSLTDRTYDARHLPPVQDADANRPSPREAAQLFLRTGETKLCPKSTVLFAYFAQWFTDGFLRSDRRNADVPGRNLSNHDIDLSQLYGIDRDVTLKLRTREGGLLKSQTINGEEYPPYLCDADGNIKPEFQGPELRGVEVFKFEELDRETRIRLFALGSDRANSHIGYLMMNVLFFREHNRLARELARRYREWDDERLFQTARNILTVVLIRIVLEEYINHITPYFFQFFVDPAAFPNERWYRQNWMAIEFNLLYRWHSLIPSHLVLDGREVELARTLYAPQMVPERGLGAMFQDASRQRAGKVSLFNTDPNLLPTEEASIAQGRQLRLPSYNDYRYCCNFPRVTAFNQISGDPQVQQGLGRLYGDVDRIDFYVGLFAEETRPNSVLPSLIGRLVGVDAFSQAFTNPLLASSVYNERTFSPYGMEVIRDTNRLSQLLHRNLSGASGEYFVSMTQAGWKRV